MVRGIVVRSRSVLGAIGASLQTSRGNISLFTELCERTRGEAFDLMVQHGSELGGALRCNGGYAVCYGGAGLQNSRCGGADNSEVKSLSSPGTPDEDTTCRLLEWAGPSSAGAIATSGSGGVDAPGLRGADRKYRHLVVQIQAVAEWALWFS